MVDGLREVVWSGIAVTRASQARLIRCGSTGLLGPASILPGPCLAMSVAQGTWRPAQLGCVVQPATCLSQA